MSEKFVRRGWNWERYGAASRPITPTASLLFRDDFRASAVDASRWGVSNEPYGAGNVEDHTYTPANVSTGAGLKITARKETVNGSASTFPAMSYAAPDGVNYAAPRTGLPAGSRPFTSGLLSSRDATTPRYYPLFSRFEIKARIPHGQGLLPAFWLRRKGGASYAEVDVMEYFFNYRPGETKFSLHFPNSLGTNVTQQRKFFETPTPGSSGFHTWAVEIRPAMENQDPLKDPVVFSAFLDGAVFASHRVTDEQALRDLHMVDRATGLIPAAGDREVWDVCINMAVGGRWVGAVDQQLGYLPLVDRCSRTQALPPSGASSCDLTGLFFATLPAVFEVEYVSINDLGYIK